jgi:hypothetical protein
MPTVLRFELEPDGGVTVEGEKESLRRFALLIIEATLVGEADLSFVSDTALTRLLVRRLDD